ncbi:MAG: hypothetical protein RLZZ265_514 [Verrucomicrobiota bacterium]|jgi:hypothetical protein
MDKATQKRIIKSNYGRDFGWYVELDGKRIAELTKPEWDHNLQFWYAYTLTPLTKDESIRAKLHTKQFWEWTELVFRSREFGLVAPDAIGVLLPDGRVSARWLDLYSQLPPKTLWDKLLDWFRFWTSCW